MVTGAIPAEVNVTGSVDAVFTVTLPNTRPDGLIVSCALATTVALSCRAKLLETLPALAVSVTACAVVTDDTVAVNPALVVFAGTTSVAGTVTAPLLLARLTLRPPLPAAAASVTVQLSVPDAAMDTLLQENAFNTGGAAVPVLAGLFTAVPQPNGEMAPREQANIANSSLHRPSNRRIQPSLQGLFELSTSVTFANVRALARDQRQKVASATCETSEQQRSRFPKDIRLRGCYWFHPEAAMSSQVSRLLTPRIVTR